MKHNKSSEMIKAEMLAHLKLSVGLDALNIKSSDSLKDLGLDSFRTIELILFLESEFKLAFPENAYTIQNLKSIDTIVDATLSNSI